MAGAALAVGAGYVYRFKLLLRIAEAYAQPDGVGKIGLEGCRANAREHGQLFVEIIECLLVSSCIAHGPIDGF